MTHQDSRHSITMAASRGDEHGWQWVYYVVVVLGDAGQAGRHPTYRCLMVDSYVLVYSTYVMYCSQADLGDAGQSQGLSPVYTSPMNLGIDESIAAT